jgi:diguanylate cyclase (GGDEF)-like protein/PAS domain S-box-containing protein
MGQDRASAEVGGAGRVSDTLDLLARAGEHPIVRGFPEGAVVVFDAGLRYLCAGGQGLATVGLTRAMLEGRTIDDVFPPAVANRLREPYRCALAGEEASLEIRFEDRVFVHRIAPLTDDDGQIVAGIGFAFDVTQARRAEEALLVERRRLRDAEAIGHSGSWEWDTVKGVITWSDGLADLHGLDRTTFISFDQAASAVHPDDRDLVDAAMDACRTSEEPVLFRYRVTRTGDDEQRWFESRATGVFEDGVVVRLVGTVADVTERVRAEAEVAAANAFQRAVLAASPDFTFIADVSTGAMVFGSHDRELFGHPRGFVEIIGPGGRERLVHPDDRPILQEANRRAVTLADGEVIDIRYRLRHADGSWRWLNRRVVPFRRDDDGTLVEVLGVIRDIDDLVNAEQQLAHDALHDSLTGLPNRALLLDRLGAALARAERDRRQIAVLFCDLDGFKSVNDTAGHATGDEVLIEVARRLRRAVREGDTVARVGGDEFVLIIEPWNRDDRLAPVSVTVAELDRSAVVDVAERVVEAMRAPVVVDGVEYQVTISVGISYPPTRGLDGSGATRAAEVVEEADAAMYRAKHEGKNRVVVFAEAVDGALIHH